jgi:hypothetical protein
MHNRASLALLALATAMLVGCKEPAGLPRGDVHAATIHTVYCPLTDYYPAGHIDYYCGHLTIVDHYDWNSQDSRIMSGFAYYKPPLDTQRPYPRINGFGVFEIPAFTWTTMVACSLFYYQESHNGTPNLAVTASLTPKEAAEVVALYKLYSKKVLRVTDYYDWKEENAFQREISKLMKKGYRFYDAYIGGDSWQYVYTHEEIIGAEEVVF